jgi:hypothetical protein
MNIKNQVNTCQNTMIDVKKPSHLIYCSDGAVEVFDEEPEELPDESSIGTMAHNYLPTPVYNAGSKLVAAADYAGEKLAYFFGITSPKYEYEIAEFNRLKEEEEQRIKAQDAEYAGWTNVNQVAEAVVIAHTEGDTSEQAIRETTPLQTRKF